ncbi:uncharacterized protein zgc:174945 [Triplophysa dalaica]|uniref:uncharacterized protein zgc:174945 n=1 Tax=Triplophysa dalaica TaxID=1582913 RepID=UPI0024DFDD8D|nr:uncharacterized protein zgc:174945 [Triplophysa dalaica]
MKVFRPNCMFLLFAVFCDLLSSIAGVAVMYPREPFTKAEGDSLSLTCMVRFQRKSCKEIQSKWCFFRTEDKCEPIIDPHRHQDRGYYQCNAKCESGTEAKGHLVHLNVTGPNVSKWSGQHKVDPALITLSVVLLFCSKLSTF